MKDKIIEILQRHDLNAITDVETIADEIVTVFEQPVCEFSWEIFDANDDVTKQKAVVVSDRHGCTISIEGFEEGFCFDFSGGRVIVRRYDDEWDDGEYMGEIVLQ